MIERLALDRQMLVTVEIPQVGNDDDIVPRLTKWWDTVVARYSIRAGVVGSQGQRPIGEHRMVFSQHVSTGEDTLARIPWSVEYLHQTTRIRRTVCQRIPARLHRHHGSDQARTQVVLPGGGDNQEGPATHR